MAKLPGIKAADGSDYVAITDGKGNLGSDGFVIGTVNTINGLNSAGATETNVAASASSVTVLAASGRTGATVFNDSSATLYLLLKTGGTASVTNYTVQIPGGGYYELPFMFTGDLIGIWSSATGNARVNEFTRF